MIDFATLTDATCGEACWQAREDVCRCCCNGSNHGITRTTGERPERNKRKGVSRYQLMAVTSYSEACAMARNDYGDWLRAKTLPGEHYPRRLYPHDRVIYNLATTSQQKWPEVQNVPLTDHWGRCDTYLVWERLDAPRTW